MESAEFTFYAHFSLLLTFNEYFRYNISPFAVHPFRHMTDSQVTLSVREEDGRSGVPGIAKVSCSDPGVDHRGIYRKWGKTVFQVMVRNEQPRSVLFGATSIMIWRAQPGLQINIKQNSLDADGVARPFLCHLFFSLVGLRFISARLSFAAPRNPDCTPSSRSARSPPRPWCGPWRSRPPPPPRPWRSPP